MTVSHEPRIMTHPFVQSCEMGEERIRRNNYSADRKSSECELGFWEHISARTKPRVVLSS